MAEIKLSQLPLALALTGLEIVPVVQAGVTTQTTAAQVSVAGVLTGDVASVTGGVTTIQPGVVSLAKQAALAAGSIQGNNQVVAATPAALSPTQVKALLAITSADISGLAPSATTDTTNASLISSGTLALARLPVIPTSDISGLSPSATTDTTNASNISSGTLALARLPVIPVSDVSGLAPSATTDTTNAANISSGVIPLARLPVIPVTDISGLAPSATSDTTNASNISSGTLAVARLPTIPVAIVSGAEQTANKGVNNGYAGLDSGGHVPTTQLPPSVLGALSYQSTWNASTNTPALVSSTGTKGWFYVCSTAGTTSLDGLNAWTVGDWAVFNGTVWNKVDGAASEVLSVAGKVGNVVISLNTDVIGTLQAAQEPAHTGDVTNAAGSLGLTIGAGVVTLAKQAPLAASSIQGNNTGSSATPIALTPAQVKVLLGVSLNSDVSGTLQAAQEPAHTGDVTNSAGSLALTIQPGAVTLAKQASLAAFSIQGNNTGVLNTPIALSPTQVKGLLAISYLDISGLAASATVNTTNASNITSGTLNESLLTVQSGLTAGAYTNTNLTIDSHGVITAVANGTGAVGASPTALVGITAIAGSSLNFMRADAAPALNQAIAPTWTNAHNWNVSGSTNGIITSNSGTGYGALFQSSGSASALYVNSTGTGPAISVTTGVSNLQAMTGTTGTFSGQVIANTYYAGGPAATQLNALTIQQTSQASWVMYQPASSSDFRIYGNGADRFVINSAGNVSAAAPSSGAALTLCTATTNVGLLITQTGESTNGQMQFVFDAGGNAYFENNVASTYLTIGNYGAGSVVQFVAGGHLAASISAVGGVSVNAPTSGVALGVTGLANSYASQINGSATSGQSYGLIIKAGTTNVDYSLAVQNQAGSTLMSVNGAGNVSVIAPASGVALTVTSFAGSNAISAIGAAGSWAAYIQGANATSGYGLAVQGSYTGAGQTSLVSFADQNNTNGVNLQLVGNGSTTPTKFIRVQNGVFGIANSAYSGLILQLNDAGALTINSNFTMATSTTAATINVGNGMVQGDGTNMYVRPTNAGALYLGANNTNYITLGTAGNVTHTAPTSGTALTVTGYTAAPIANLISGSSATTTSGDLVVARAGSTANAVAQGPNLYLGDTTNNTTSLLQNSGGQTELWQYNASAWNQILRVNTNRSVAIAAPASGNTLTVYSVGGASTYGAYFLSPNTAGVSNGITIQAGTNSTDRALYVINAAGTVGLFGVAGDGTINCYVATAASATAGGASALPATPWGYFYITIGSTPVKVPYYKP